MSALGDLAHLLISEGLPPEAIAQVIDLVVQHGREQVSLVHRNPPDVHPMSTGDKRREYDRTRKRLQRGLRLPEHEWIPLVAKILQRDNRTCTYCGSKERLTADHVVPLTRGGTNDTSNLTACCLPCNTKKSNKFISEWLPASSVKFHPDVHPNPPDTENVDILTSLSSSLLSEETLKKERKKESSGIRARDASAVPDDWPADYGDLFWRAYPRKEEKIAAMRKLATLRKSGIVTFVDLMAGLKRYCSVDREPQFIKGPTVWLNKGCWADETQTGARNVEGSDNKPKTGHDAIFAAFARKARELAGDSSVAGAAGEDEFPIGDGSDREPKDVSPGPFKRSSEAHDWRESFSLEGEIIPPNKATVGLPNGRGRR